MAQGPSAPQHYKPPPSFLTGFSSGFRGYLRVRVQALGFRETQGSGGVEILSPLNSKPQTQNTVPLKRQNLKPLVLSRECGNEVPCIPHSP